MGKHKSLWTSSKLKLGVLVDLLAYTAFWLGIINFALIAVTSYSTTIAPFLKDKIPGLNIWWFMGVLVLVVGIFMLLEYFLFYPARQAFRNRWEYSHESPIKKDLEKIKKHLGIKDEDTTN